MILIVGASGKLGRALARKLLVEGKSVRCLSRTPEQLTDLKDIGADICRGDLKDSESLDLACIGVRTVIASAHSLLGRGKERSKLVDYQGNINLINAAKKANVEYFIYISVLFADPNLPVPFAQYKYKVEQYLKDSGINYTIFRPSAFFEDHAYLLIGKTIVEKGKAILLGNGESLTNYVAVEDVAKFVLLALKNIKLHCRTIIVGGPDNFTQNQVITLYEKATGKKAKVTRVPIWMLKIMSFVLRPIHQGLSQIIALNVYLNDHGASFDMGETLKEFPMDLIPLKKWIEKQQPY